MQNPVSQDGSAEASPSARAEAGAISSRISRDIVRLHATLYGRGPTKAKTYLEEDYALCVLQEVFTPGERTLVETGHADQVQATRNAFQEAVETQFVEAVESSSGRVVMAFFSMIHIGSDTASELFLFEERGVATHPDRGSMTAPPGEMTPQAAAPEPQPE